MAKSFTQTGIESDLHAQITNEAARNKKSFSAQIREYRDYFFAGEEKIINLRIQIRELEEKIQKITDVN